MALPKIGLEAILEMAGFNRAAAKYQKIIKELSGFTEGLGVDTDLMGEAFDKLLPIVGGAGLVVDGATAAFYGLQKALEFGKEGAVLAQTKDSFDRLMDSMGVAPDILQQMNDATLNTVDNQTLMSSTMTLLAGTSDELGKKIAEVSPQLLKIAKAANKLNPSLGDTAFLYNSLATGVKRSSPLILDNLGLTIKIGTANEAMAQKLGKSVEALTAEEKQMALLEATLEAGDRMIQQVGGNVESMGDAFLESEKRLKDLTNQLKMDTLPTLVELFEDVAKIIEAVASAYDTFKQLNAIIMATRAAKTALFTLQDPLEAFREEFAKQTKLLETAEERFDRLTGGVDAFSDAFDPYQEMMLEAAKATGELGDAQYEASLTTDDLAKAQKALDGVIKDIRKSYEDFFGSLAKGIVKYRDLGKAQAESAKSYQQKLADLRAEAGKAYTDIQENFKASLPDATTVQDRMGMAGDAWDEWGLRIQAIIEGGIENPWYQTLRDMGYEKPPDVGLTAWLEDLKEKFYAGQLPDLLPPEWADKVKQQQEAATAAVQAENAKRLAEVQKARQAELEAERQARNDATIELALTLAEQSGLLQQWSLQRFGPDFSQVADTAGEVLGLLESGMLDIDEDLQTIIENSVAGVQQALDTTGSIAEETQGKLDEIASKDWVEEKKQQLDDAFDMNRLEAPWTSTMATLGAAVPKTPFDPFIWSFEDAQQTIISQATLMGLDLGGTFDTIDLDWAAMVQSQVSTWNTGMSDVEKAIQEKVIEKLAEIPTKIVVTVTTEQEGGEPEGKQAGGPVAAGVPYLVGERGPELFVPDVPGIIVPNSGTGAPIQITINPVINNGMDLAEFEAVTTRTIQRALGGV